MSNSEAAHNLGVGAALGSYEAIDLKGVADAFARRWKLFAAICLAIVIIAVGSALIIRPVYDAAATIRIDPTQRSALNLQDVANGTMPDQALVDTEVKVMQSREVARSVVQTLGLTADPEFNQRGFFDIFGKPGTSVDAVTDRVQRGLRAMREGPTYIISMHYKSHDPGKAARIANAFAVAYVQTSIEAKARAAAQQAVWYSQRMASVSTAAQQANTSLEQYKAANGIVDSSNGSTVTQQQIQTVTQQLATAEAEAAAARSNIDAARAQVSKGGLDSVSSVLNSPTIIELRRQRGDLMRSRDEIETRYGPKHPETVKIIQQVEGLEQQIKDESARIISGLESDARASEAKAASVRNELKDLKDELATNGRASVQADNLKREADAKNAMLSQLATSAQQSEQQQYVNQSQAVIVATATPPGKPAFPSLPLFAVLGLALGLTAGAGGVAAAETLDSGLRSAESILPELGIPFIAYSPIIRKRSLIVDGKTIKPWDYVVAKPMSAYAESMRTARSAIKLSDIDKRYKIVAVTSALPAEGKTVSSVSLARVMAMSGEKVLLMDCDLRRNVLEGLLPKQPDAGLVEVLSGTATVESVITPDIVPGLHILPLQKAQFNPRDLFGTNAMKALLESLRDQYDYIVLDGPPILAVNDARTLATLADVVLMVAHWGTTPKQAVRAALSHLEHDQAPVAGLILTMVDTGAALGGNAAGSGYYYGRYAKYYQE